MDDELRVLLAKDAIRDQLYNYVRSCDRLDPELGYSVFAEEAITVNGNYYNGGARGFIDMVMAAHARKVMTSHQISNLIIKVNGDKAGSEAYVTAAIESEKEGKLYMQVARCRYNDQWELRNGKWLIVKRVASFDIDYTTQIEKDSGIHASTRDKTDPSYTVIG